MKKCASKISKKSPRAHSSKPLGSGGHQGGEEEAGILCTGFLCIEVCLHMISRDGHKTAVEDLSALNVKLTVILPAKLISLGIAEELQFGTYYPIGKSRGQRRGTYFTEKRGGCKGLL